MEVDNLKRFNGLEYERMAEKNDDVISQLKSTYDI